MTDLSSGYSQVLKATDGNTTVYYTRGFELISRREGDASSFYLYDSGLSVRALTDETGAITDTLVFDAFGNETEKTGTTSNTYGFQGEEHDATGLYYLRARYMDPASGTFTSMDTYAGSLSDPISLHKYLFANSNPVMYSDPSGHSALSLEDTLTAIAIITIFASSIAYSIVMNSGSKGALSTDSFANSNDFAQIKKLSDIKQFNDVRKGLLSILLYSISNYIKGKSYGKEQRQVDHGLSGSGNTIKPNNKNNKENYKKVDEDYIREKTDMEPHDIKKDVLGKNSKDISKYDIYRNTVDKQLYLVPKSGGTPLPTGYYIY